MADPVRDFALNTDGSFVKTGSDFNFVAGRAATKQGARIRVLTFKPEIFVDQDQGVDYVGRVLGKSDPLVARQEIKDAIADTPDILEVVGANIILSTNRDATVKYRYRDVYTEGAVTDELSVP